MKQKTKDEIFDLMLYWIIGVGHTKNCPQIHAKSSEAKKAFMPCTCGLDKLIQLAEDQK